MKNKITKTELIDLLRLIESYVVRRTICGIPTNSLNKTFATLYKQADQENLLDSLKARLGLETSYRRFPNDEEFIRQLKIKDAYNLRIRNYLLNKLENFDRKEFVDISEYTIEHILPQNPELSQEWRLDLGKDWKNIQQSYLHTIGNLTLTGYNSELSDSPFKIKRDMVGGFKDSPIRLNRSLAKLDKWDESEISNRAKEISDLAVNIWSYPSLDAKILEKYRTEEKKKGEKVYTIEDHTYLKKGQPMRESFDLLRKKILNIDSSVREKPKKLYVAYKSITNFVDIIPQKNALLLSLNIPFKTIKDPLEKCNDVSNLGRWGNGDTEVKISNLKDIDYVMGLIKQAFEYIIESEIT